MQAEEKGAPGDGGARDARVVGPRSGAPRTEGADAPGAKCTLVAVTAGPVQPADEDGARMCTGAPGAVAARAGRLRLRQESTNGEVVWIVATGRQPGIYTTAADAKDQWDGYPKARHCAMNRRQFEAGEHVRWYAANFGGEGCAVKPMRGRKRKTAADESDEDAV